MTLTALDQHRYRSATPADGAWILAAPFRAHLRRLLRETGLPWRALALRAGVEPSVVRALLHGRGGRAVHRVHPQSARRLLGLTPEDLHALTRRHVPAAQVPAMLRSLRAAGMTEERLGRCLRLPRHEVRALTAGSVLYCTAMTALLVEALWGFRTPEGLAA